MRKCTPAAIERTIAGALSGNIWFVAAGPWTDDPDDRIRRLLDRRLTVREEASFAGVRLRLYAGGADASAVAGIATRAD